MAPYASPSPAASFEQYETGTRNRAGFGGALIALVAGSWSLFQLAIARHVLLSTETVRCIHLAFALVLVYLSFPAVKRPGTRARLESGAGRRLAFLFDPTRIYAADYVLAGLAAAAALYLVLDYEGIGQRLGTPLARDLVAGMVLVVLLLEAARRALGLALPLIASCFILYSFFSESMPGIIAFKNATLSKLINKLTLTTEGIYGVPLDVSAIGGLPVRAVRGHAGKGGRRAVLHRSWPSALLGRFRGGPAKAAVLASGLTGMVNGSSIANTVTTGTFTIPLMKRTGFPAIKAGAIEVAASTNGQLMPPIMGAAAFIIAEYCNLTYFEVVRAAFVPAVISYLALIYIVHLEACKLGLQPLPREELPRFCEGLLQGHPLPDPPGLSPLPAGHCHAARPSSRPTTPSWPWPA